MFRYFYNHLINYAKTIICLRLINIGEYSLHRRGEYSPIFTLPSANNNYWKVSQYLTLNDWSRGEQWILFPQNLNVSRDEVEANNCFSIITQVITEISKQRNVKFYHNLPLFKSLYHAARVYVSRNAFFSLRSERTFDVHTVR